MNRLLENVEVSVVNDKLRLDILTLNFETKIYIIKYTMADYREFCILLAINFYLVRHAPPIR